MENRALEFLESHLERIQEHRGEILLRLSPARVHHSAGKPGLDKGRIFEQNIILRFTGAEMKGDPSLLPATLADGKLIAGERSLYLVPLPFETKDEVVLKLICEEEGEIEIRAEELKVEETGEPEFLEDFP